MLTQRHRGHSPSSRSEQRGWTGIRRTKLVSRRNGRRLEQRQVLGSPADHEDVRFGGIGFAVREGQKRCCRFSGGDVPVGHLVGVGSAVVAISSSTMSRFSAKTPLTWERRCQRFRPGVWDYRGNIGAWTERWSRRCSPTGRWRGSRIPSIRDRHAPNRAAHMTLS